MKPLNEKERIFAADNEGVISWYLNLHHLDYDTYYDIAVFGYLRAVKAYLNRPELQKYSFKTIALWRMKSDVGNYHRALKRRKRSAEVYSLNAETEDELTLHERVGTYDPEPAIDEKILLDAIKQETTPEEWDVLNRKADGYTHKEIGDTHHFSKTTSYRRLRKLRERIRPMFEDEYAAA